MATKIPFRPSNQAWDMLSTAQQIDQCCGLGRGVNLLDNWWFGKGVINQRGITPGTLLGSQYGIDRWVGRGINSWELRSGGGLIIHSADTGYVSIDQRFQMSDFDAARPLCISILYSEEPESPSKLLSTGGVWTSNLNSFQDDNFYVAFTTNYPTAGKCSFRIISYPRSHAPIIWAVKLEYGTEQTLAHLDSSGSWVLNDPPPNPTTELLKCQRYQLLGHLAGGYLAKVSDTAIRVIIHLPVQLRAIPAIIGNPMVYGVSPIRVYPEAKITPYLTMDNLAILTVTGLGVPGWVYFPRGTGFDANL